LSVGHKSESGDASERGDVLVLFADWFLEDVDFDAACLFGELAGPDSAGARDFRALLELTFHVMRGMALQRILRDDDTERRRLFELWKQLVSESLGRAKRWEK